MNQIANLPRNLAFEPLDSQHILACERVAYETVRALIEACGKGKWLEQIRAAAPLSCCHDPANLDIEAWFTMTSEQAKGVPDLYKFYCRVCEAKVQTGEKTGCCHAKWCVGFGDERPVWEIR